ncbi:MAG: oligosaccharide flippase family protein, partial [Psychroserpens sp.]|nr:oligosaccharide flippase family protein [Psychroserpens sp.]
MKLFQIKDKNFKELIRGGSAAFILKVSGMLFTYLSMLFITRYFGAEAWGLYTLGFTVLSMAIVVPVFGFDNALIRLIADLKENYDGRGVLRLLFFVFIITVSLSLVVILGLEYFSDTISNQILKQEGFKPYLTLVQIAVIP